MRILASAFAIALLAAPVAAAPVASSASPQTEATESVSEGPHAPPPMNFFNPTRYWEEQKEYSQKGGEAPTPMYIYLLINFLVLMAIYYGAFGKTFSDMLKARKEAFEKQVADGRRVQDEASARLKEYEAKLAASDSELAKIRAELLAQGESDRDRIVKEAERKVEAIRHDAMRMVEQELKQLRQDLLRETVHVATAAARQTLTTKLTSEDQERFVAAYIDDVSRADSKVMS
jgi:F-type H+-transporting ATPase subunit b